MNGTTALVLGGDCGVGRAVAVEAARQGADVAVVSEVGGPHLDPLSREVSELGRRFRLVTLDGPRPEQVEAIVEDLVEAWGRIDALYAMEEPPFQPMSIDEVSADSWDELFERYLKPPFLFAQALSEQFLPGAGAIVVLSSTAAKYKPILTSSPGAALQSAMCGMTRQLAVIFGPLGVRVNAILSGLTEDRGPPLDTPGAEQLGRDMPFGLADVPLGRMGTFEDYARTAVWLASPANSFITGETVSVCGGHQMG